MVKVKSMHTSQMAHQAGVFSGFCRMKRLGIFLIPLDEMLVHRRVTPSIKFAGTYLYTWVKRGTVRVKCLAQEHNTMSPAWARTRTARSGVERTNHEATMTDGVDKNVLVFGSNLPSNDCHHSKGFLCNIETLRQGRFTNWSVAELVAKATGSGGELDPFK